MAARIVLGTAIAASMLGGLSVAVATQEPLTPRQARAACETWIDAIDRWLHVRVAANGIDAGELARSRGELHRLGRACEGPHAVPSAGRLAEMFDEVNGSPDDD